MTTNGKNDKVFKYRWKDHFQSEDGPSHISRHVLLALLDFMDDNGGSCFPSLQLIARRAGLARSTVQKHITLLVKQGWIRKQQRWLSDKNSWKSNIYQAVIPKKLKGVYRETVQGIPRDGTGYTEPRLRVYRETDTNTPESIPGSIENSLPAPGGDGEEFFQVPKDEIAKLKNTMSKNIAELQSNLKKQRQRHNKEKKGN